MYADKRIVSYISQKSHDVFSFLFILFYSRVYTNGGGASKQTTDDNLHIIVYTLVATFRRSNVTVIPVFLRFLLQIPLTMQ